MEELATRRPPVVPAADKPLLPLLVTATLSTISVAFAAVPELAVIPFCRLPLTVLSRTIPPIRPVVADPSATIPKKLFVISALLMLTNAFALPVGRI